MDPYTGALTIYPALFHVIFGNLNRILGWEPYFLWKFIEVLQFAMLLLGFYFFARPIIRSPGVFACSFLAISLVVYAPTGRYYCHWSRQIVLLARCSLAWDFWFAITWVENAGCWSGDRCSWASRP